MSNLWLVAQHEYRRTVLRRGFIIGTLAGPLGIIALITLVIAIEISRENRLPIGYVDNAGVLSEARQTALPNPADRIPIRAFPDEPAARAALERDEIQAFFVLPEAYLQTLSTDLYYQQNPPDTAVWRDFDDFVRLNLTAAFPAEVQQRLLAGPAVTVYDLTSGREFSEQGIINIILPIVASILFFIITLSASGYLLRVVADEKENRTMEIMLTSLTPTQLIGGKTAGLLGAVLTQVAIYLIVAAIGLVVASGYIPELQHVVVPWAYLGLMLLFFLPTFALLTATMVAVGAALPNVQEAQQIVGLVNLMFMAPVFLLTILMEDPAHPAMVFLTLFPTSAFLTISLRWGLGTVPLWQLAVSWMLLVSSALLMTWAAAQIFRVGMLRYGNPLSLKGMWAAVRGAAFKP